MIRTAKVCDIWATMCTQPWPQWDKVLLWMDAEIRVLPLQSRVWDSLGESHCQHFHPVLLHVAEAVFQPRVMRGLGFPSFTKPAFLGVSSILGVTKWRYWPLIVLTPGAGMVEVSSCVAVWKDQRITPLLSTPHIKQKRKNVHVCGFWAVT